MTKQASGSVAPSAPPFWTVPVSDLLADFATSPAGLTTSEASLRLRRWGPNELAPPRRGEAIREIARYFANPLVVLAALVGMVVAYLGLVELVKRRLAGLAVA